MAPNIFVCTVHIGSEPFWAQIQPRFIRANIPEATLVASFDDEGDRDADYDLIQVSDGEHKDKLDALADHVVAHMAQTERDILIFHDGDAFPIRSLTEFIHETLTTVPLAAICRTEMPGENFPHPSFCVTTVDFWSRIGGTWALSSDETTSRNDLGCRLRDLLEEREIEWRQLLRSNRFNPHPVLFGIYGGLIYHHGAGFRRPVTTADRELWRDVAPAGTWITPDRYRFFFDVVARQNGILSDVFRLLIANVPGFHTILERDPIEEE